LGAIAIAVLLCDGLLLVLPPSDRIPPSALILFDIMLAVVMAGIWWVLVRPLRVSQIQLRSFLDNATVGMLTSTADGRPTMVNRRLVEMLGYASAKDLLGRNLGTDVYRSPEERVRVTGIMSSLGEFEDIEANWKRKDGSPITVSLKGRTIRGADGQLVGFEGAIEDVTEQRRQQRHLRLVEEALNAAANAIVITDSAGAVEWVNPAFTNLTGYALDEVKGQTPRAIKSGQTDPTVYQALWAAIGAGQVWRGELVNRRKDGSLYQQELTITPMRGEDGAVSHFIGVSQDVTERRRLEAQLRQAQKMETIGQLTGGIAHDFNNVLAVILANAELVATAAHSLDPAAQDDLADIKAAAARGAEMVKKLLGFSRLAELRLVPVDLGDVVRGIAAILRRLLPENVEITVAVSDAIPPVRADVGAVEQVVINLATNGRDAMPNGGALRIDVSRATMLEEDKDLHEWIEPGEYVCLSVSDTGIGMDEATRKHMFEPFFTTKPPGKGTGLGMAMIYGLTKQHGGFVHVYSEPGRGTTVRTYYPAAREEAAVALNITQLTTELQGHGERILLAEDEEALRRTGKRVLERLGYRVMVAVDGEEALALYRTHQDEIALVISDLVMPKVGGRELYDAVKGIGRPVKFILATGYAVAELRASQTFDGPVQHLPKPWTITEVAEAVYEALHPRPQAKAP
jgi:two-component system, cell cycle sensor histidine kinase and response regulator CckA